MLNLPAPIAAIHGWQFDGSFDLEQMSPLEWKPFQVRSQRSAQGRSRDQSGCPGCLGPMRSGRIISLSSCSTMWQCQTN